MNSTGQHRRPFGGSGLRGARIGATRGRGFETVGAFEIDQTSDIQLILGFPVEIGGPGRCSPTVGRWLQRSAHLTAEGRDEAVVGGGVTDTLAVFSEDCCPDMPDADAMHEEDAADGDALPRTRRPWPT